MAQNTFYGDGNQEQVYERVNQRIHEMLPRLTTLNNRQLALGKERKESRKRHFDEKHPDLKKEVTAKKPSRKLRVAKKKSEEEQKKAATAAAPEAAPAPSEKEERPAGEKKEEQSSPLVQNENQLSEQNQSGVVGVETSSQTHKSNADDVTAFLMNGAENEVEVDGWDDFIVCFQSYILVLLGCKRVSSTICTLLLLVKTQIGSSW